MRILLSGICGHMGQEVVRLAAAGCRGAEIASGVDVTATGDETIPTAFSFDLANANVDCIIDFSHHAATAALLAFAVKNHLPLVLATTGQTEEERAAIRAAAEKTPIFFAANYSLGIALLIELAKKAVSLMPGAEIEIVETHHDRKADAPSGTALAIAEAIREVRPELAAHTGRAGYGKRSPNEIGIHSIRMGDAVGTHEVLIGTKSETITLKHEAYSRALFAEGALAAAEFLIGKPAGLYDMRSLI